MNDEFRVSGNTNARDLARALRARLESVESVSLSAIGERAVYQMVRALACSNILDVPLTVSFAYVEYPPSKKYSNSAVSTAIFATVTKCLAS